MEKDNYVCDYKSKIDGILKKYDGEKPGASVAVVKDGQIIYIKNVGLANLEYNILIDRNTVFNIASISKPITAIGIIILKEKAALSYDDEIIKYFPELKHYCKGVTIRHLLNHTSGIINYYRILDRINMSELHLTNNECYNLLINEKNLLFAPGDEFDYSNSNYVLLAMLIEKVTGKTLNDFLKENIFKPLEMNNSMVFNEKQPIVKNRAYGYGIKDNYFYCDYTGAFTTGDGCIYSSMDDLIKFEKALYSDEIIKKESLKEAFISSVLNNGEDSGYGFGWETHRSIPNLKRLHHSGADNGFRSLFTTFPEHRLTVIILSNFNEFTWDDRLNITNYFIEKYIV